ncbi:MAG: hypothetical protein Q8M15_07725 [Bacteroidota bacterium]|nr:hypothetical protein [Bacteroidota bacterium]
MKRIIQIVLIMLVSNKLLSQNETVQLIGESADGKTVKMIWFFKTWNKNTIGFDIKRRTINSLQISAWEKLNNSPIVPEIALNKNLFNTGVSDNESQRLKLKLGKLITTKKTKEIHNKDYLMRLSNDPSALQGLSFAIALDYDFALLNGFAFIDQTAIAGNNYEYGLFLIEANQTANEPVSVFSWMYGTKSLLEPDIEISGRKYGKTGKVELNWFVNTDKMKTVHVAGFNIYKKITGQWIRQNSYPLNSKTSQAGKYVWFDTTAIKNEIILYAVALQSIFNNEGEKVEYFFNPSEYPAEYKTPVLDKIILSGENYKSGFNINWSFASEQEKFIKGFVIEKSNLPYSFQKVTDIIPAKIRSYTDSTYSPPASYIGFRVKVIYSDETQLNSNEKLIYFLPEIRPPTPMNLKIKWTHNEKKLYADLSWDPKRTDDTLTDYYLLYATNPVNEQFMQAGSLPIKTNTYRYEINYPFANPYKFCVSAVSVYKSEGALSDTVRSISPSQKLPYISINNLSLDSNRVLINWDYPEIWDLKGFRIFQNGNMVASEFQLNKTNRTFKTPGLKLGASYQFMIQAVSENGIISELSIPSEINIIPQPRK